MKTVLCKKLSKYATFARIQQCFDLSKRLLIKLGIEKELQLEVEDAMCQEWKEQTVDHKFTCMLQGISVKFPFFHSPEQMNILVILPNFLVSTLHIMLVKICSMETTSVRLKTNQRTWERLK